MFFYTHFPCQIGRKTENNSKNFLDDRLENVYSLANYMYTVIVFSFQHHDWQELMKFNLEQDAENFVRSYPRFGARHSRTIRAGNWQIINE
jgi:hypothetical protein